MSQTVELEETFELHDAPHLLVEWSSPWHEFFTSIGPALARSEARLAGETPHGIFPYRGGIPVLLVEALLVFAVIVVRLKLDELRPYVVQRLSGHDVIYYSGDELPRTEDLGGAQAGATGRAGGDQAHHPTQTIKIARGSSLTQKVVDAPDLKLPSSRDAVANLLAIKPNPGPPPLQGLRSKRATLTLPSPVVAPAPNVIRDYTRNGVQLDTVIAPSPTAPRDPFRSAPNLSATVIPPAPGVTNDHALVAPVLVPAVIAPAPKVSRDRTSAAPSLSANVVAPAPTVSSAAARPAPTLSANVIPPAPGAVSREISKAPVQMTNVAVVPPPASAPERATKHDPKLALPPPSVIAPPPSADTSQDLRRLASGSVPDPAKNVVPPPPVQSGSGSMMSSLIGKIFGASEVVPPPPAVTANHGSGSNGTSLAANVVPPPPSVAPKGSRPRGRGNGLGVDPGSNVIAPPPSAGVPGGSGTRSVASSTAPALGPPSVVPPPPSLSGPGGGTGNTGGGKGVPGGTLSANNVVPPPPSVGGGSGSNGSGLGYRGPGFAGPMDVGAPTAPATSGGSTPTSSVVVSSQPGNKVGLPATGGKGALAMSPTGGDKPGLGGSGGGTGIARGNGPGSGLHGEGSGAGKSGVGRGSDPSARGGVSLSPGPGGTGNAPAGTPPVQGVSVEGGSTVVTLPSFGDDPAAGAPRAPGRSSVGGRKSFDVDIVANAGSGGAFEPYKKLLKSVTGTIYPETSSMFGSAVMEYADESATGGLPLTAPQPVRTNLPDGLARARMVFVCKLDTSGNLKGIRTLEPGPADVTAKVIVALHSWKFQPALRGNQPVEVTAIIGFGINTDDRF